MAAVIVFILALGLSPGCLQRPAKLESVVKARGSQKDRTAKAQVKEKRAAGPGAEEAAHPTVTGSSPCRLRVVTEPTAVRRGVPNGVLIDHPHVRIEGCPAHPRRVQISPDIPDRSGILKKEADQVRAFPVPDIADSGFNLRVIRVVVKAKCLNHGTEAQGILEIRVFPPGTGRPSDSGGAPRRDQPPPKLKLADEVPPSPPRKELSGKAGQAAIPSLKAPPSSGKGAGDRPPEEAFFIRITSPKPEAAVESLVVVRGKAKLPPGQKQLTVYVEARTQGLRLTVPLQAGGEFSAAVVLDQLLTPGYNAPVWVYARSGKVESHRLRIWPH